MALTVRQLIAELQRMPPDKTVKVLLSSVSIDDGSLGSYELDLSDEDALPADEVRDLGSHVLIRSE